MNSLLRDSVDPVKVFLFASLLFAGCGEISVDQGADSTTIEILQPRGGEIFVTGGPVLIVWAAKPTSVNSVRIFASGDGGVMWKCISGPMPYPMAGDTGRFAWTIGDTAFPADSILGKPCRIRIVAPKSSGEAVSGFFSAAAVKILAPNGKERYRVDSALTVRVELDSSVVDNLVLKISFDNGIAWLPLTDGALLVSQRVFTFEWPVAAKLYDDMGNAHASVSDSCLIWASDYEEDYVAVSEHVFSIAQ